MSTFVCTKAGLTFDVAKERRLVVRNSSGKVVKSKPKLVSPLYSLLLAYNRERDQTRMGELWEIVLFVMSRYNMH
jgi:hypothetical protein